MTGMKLFSHIFTHHITSFLLLKICITEEQLLTDMSYQIGTIQYGTHFLLPDISQIRNIK